MTDLYRNAAVDDKVETAFTFDEKIITDLLHSIHEQRIDVSHEIDEQLYHAVHRVFDKAAAVGTGVTSPHDQRYSFLREIKENNGVFAAFKTHRMQNDIARQLLDEKGQLKSFQQFRSDTQSIVSHHSDAWLRTEYNTAVKRAQVASQMRQFRDEADVLPNLRWLPSTAINPREAHIPFYDRVWSIDDEFWQSHRPADEWGCQCDWEATSDPTTDNNGVGEVVAQPSRGLRSKRTQEAQLFTDDHPYFPDKCGACPFNKTSPLTFHNKGKDCYSCKSVSDATQAAKIKQRKELKLAYKDVRDQIATLFGYDTIIRIPTGQDGGTGKLIINTEGLNACLRVHSHTRSVESKHALLAAISFPNKLYHIERKLLGATKNTTDAKDLSNIERKKGRGVVAYNYYAFHWGGRNWVIGLEEMKDKYEQPYFVALKK